MPCPWHSKIHKYTYIYAYVYIYTYNNNKLVNVARYCHNYMSLSLAPFVQGGKKRQRKEGNVIDVIQPMKLKNLGNTCYLNTALQLLSNCQVFSRRLSFVFDVDGVLPTRPLPSRESRAADLKRHLVHEIERVMRIIFNNNEERILSSVKYDKNEIIKNDDESISFSPYKLRFLFGRLFHHFKGNNQQDSHEFFIHILNVIHEMSLAPITTPSCFLQIVV